MSAAIPDPWFRARPYSTPLFARLDKPPFRELRKGERALGPFILPPFQRDPVWTTAQKVLFIESLWAGLPVGACVVNLPDWSDPPVATFGWLLDGQQRWSAVFGYVANEFPVFRTYYGALNVRDHSRFGMLIFPELHTNLTDPGECREVCERLAYGGTPHV
ncbi:Domain of unknown function DUF262 [uncultured Caudovirales phage]|uniref:GmrSD restriction endonucleases N-terminal domain-containing protein n=1 Tax=uncultured Caudovirales phage TaxID=2100421 RepID=A0A6J5LTG4_9CAUD|nr:Domain of unknown function DUF262 [uncultured Caudovirales phage]